MSEISVNHWPEARCAKAFWNQHELPPYQELLRDTARWLHPAVGQRWLDLGCGSGQLARVLWEKSSGTVQTIIGVDVAEINAQAFAKLRGELQPAPTPACLRFVACDFARGFPGWPDEQFDGVVSGLSLPYAESYSDEADCWTDAAYERVLAEVHRLLKPGGAFVFSVNVPNPSWSAVAMRSVGGAMRKDRPLRFLKNAWRMWSYGNWLSRESRRGRFHYLPVEAIIAKLEAANFAGIEHRLSYAGQAYLLRCWKA